LTEADNPAVMIGGLVLDVANFIEAVPPDILDFAARVVVTLAVSRPLIQSEYEFI
jgi:hypothetical protein